jgi:ketosteroid isomerase-like protein
MASLPAPQEGTIAFTKAINEANLEAATRCFARDGCLITPDSTAIFGREDVRPVLAQLISRRSRIDVQARSILVAGEVALGSERWQISSPGVNGTVFEQVASPRLVLRYLEGAWKLAIAAPWGLR